MINNINPALLKAIFEKKMIQDGTSREEVTKIIYEYLNTIIEAEKKIQESKTNIPHSKPCG